MELNSSPKNSALLLPGMALVNNRTCFVATVPSGKCLGAEPLKLKYWSAVTPGREKCLCFEAALHQQQSRHLRGGALWSVLPLVTRQHSNKHTGLLVHTLGAPWVTLNVGSECDQAQASRQVSWAHHSVTGKVIDEAYPAGHAPDAGHHARHQRAKHASALPAQRILQTAEKG